MLITTGVFLAFIFAGPYMPEVIQHKGASLSRMVSHMWLTTEGVYGVALGVSVQFIFLFVLFGTLLDIAGAGNYMMQVSIALLGHLRGGPAKVAVVSSALNGVVSGSSVSNVVSGGIFTIPLMKRTGYSGVKAGAIEAASSINGQIMPPVMGAAAFLMVEYVGIPYSEIIKHAALPAVISYVALFYIVHLEALKYGMQPIPRGVPSRPHQRLIEGALGVTGTLAAVALIYYGVTVVQRLFGPSASWVLAILTGGGYLGLLAFSARYPDLPIDDPKAPVHPAAGALAHGARGIPLPGPPGGAPVVPHGRGAVARTLGVLGHRHRDRHGGAAAAAPRAAAAAGRDRRGAPARARRPLEGARPRERAT